MALQRTLKQRDTGKGWRPAGWSSQDRIVEPEAPEVADQPEPAAEAEPLKLSPGKLEPGCPDTCVTCSGPLAHLSGRPRFLRCTAPECAALFWWDGPSLLARDADPEQRKRRKLSHTDELVPVDADGVERLRTT